LRQFFLFTVIVAAGTGGELCVARAMKNVGTTLSFRPAQIIKVIARGLCQPFMWAGVTMMALAFFAFLGALATYNVSYVVPVTALSYVVGAFGGAFFLRERVSRRRWIGVLLVAIGVTVVLISKN
jgi:drug/metabolite transporter (DMT)-like permease